MTQIDVLTNTVRQGMCTSPWVDDLYIRNNEMLTAFLRNRSESFTCEGVHCVRLKGDKWEITGSDFFVKFSGSRSTSTGRLTTQAGSRIKLVTSRKGVKVNPAMVEWDQCRKALHAWLTAHVTFN